MDYTRRGVLAGGIALTVGGCVESGGSSGGDWPDTDWPTVAYDERNRGAIGDGTAPHSLSEAWAVDVGEVTSSPVAADGTVYVANRDTLRAISIASGEFELFEFQANVSGTPTLDDGIFVPTTSEDDDGALVRLDPSGDPDWRLSLAGGGPTHRLPTTTLWPFGRMRRPSSSIARTPRWPGREGSQPTSPTAASPSSTSRQHWSMTAWLCPARRGFGVGSVRTVRSAGSIRVTG